jgi:hypothetical protein
MILAPDKRLHLYGGIATAAASAGVVELGKHFGAPLAIAAGGVALWAFVEAYQWMRGNGTPEVMDMFWGALPSVLLGVVLWWRW